MLPPKIKKACVSPYLFHFSGQTVLSHCTLKPMIHFLFLCTWTLLLLKQIYSFLTLMQLLHSALETTPRSHTLLLDALPNQFTKLSSLEPDPEVPSPLPGSLNLKVRLTSLAPSSL